MKWCFKIIWLLGVVLASIKGANAQQTDSLYVNRDSIKRSVSAAVVTDSLSAKQIIDSLAIKVDSSQLPSKQTNFTGRINYSSVLKQHPWFNFLGRPVSRIESEHLHADEDLFFYLLAGLFFFLGIIKTSFPRYFENIFSLVFRASLKQKQIREQLLQAALPSLLLNILFVLSGGLFVFFVLQHYSLLQQFSFWWLLLYSCGVVAITYLVKYLVLRFTGWVFNMKEAAATYIFIVYLVNKLMGIFLLPVLAMLAFAPALWKPPLITAGFAIVLLFFVYRYLVSFAPVRREVKVSQFHFFIYLCAFEIAPLLLMYKVLQRFL
jgi:hypothetical protein